MLACALRLTSKVITPASLSGCSAISTAAAPRRLAFITLVNSVAELPHPALRCTSAVSSSSPACSSAPSATGGPPRTSSTTAPSTDSSP